MIRNKLLFVTLMLTGFVLWFAVSLSTVAKHVEVPVIENRQ